MEHSPHPPKQKWNASFCVELSVVYKMVNNFYQWIVWWIEWLGETNTNTHVQPPNFWSVHTLFS